MIETKAAIDQLKCVPDTLTDEDQTKLTQELDRIRAAVALWKKHEDYLGRLKELIAQAGQDAMRRADRLNHRPRNGGLEDFGKEAAVAGVVQEIKDRHRQSVVYIAEKPGAPVEGPGPRQPGANRREDIIPSLVIRSCTAET